MEVKLQSDLGIVVKKKKKKTEKKIAVQLTKKRKEKELWLRIADAETQEGASHC
jgi:hypothetical protein